jgi:hypothetical protein
MCIALIGGMDRLERNYIKEAESFGVKLKVFTKSKKEIASKVKNVDALIVFTNKVSHKLKNEVVSIAKERNITVLMCHSCGISTLRDCLICLKKNIESIKGGKQNGNI